MFSGDLANRIYAGADMFLMPSKFEPCGLAQMIALRYGTIPIVRETGGLKDTVHAFVDYAATSAGAALPINISRFTRPRWVSNRPVSPTRHPI